MEDKLSNDDQSLNYPAIDYDTSSNDWADKCPLTRNRRGVRHIGARSNHRRNNSARTHFGAFEAKRAPGSEARAVEVSAQQRPPSQCHRFPPPHPPLDVDAELLAVQHHRTLRSLHPGPLDVADLVRAGELTEEDRLDGEVVDTGRGGDEVSRGRRGRVSWGVGNWNGGECARGGRVFTGWGDREGAGRDLP